MTTGMTTGATTARSSGSIDIEDVVWRRGVTMRARDGTELVSDLWHPARGGAWGDGPWPTLVVRAAYGREVASAVTAPHPSVFARAGYLVVTQDVRGRGDSGGGPFDPFVHEAVDGADTVAWAAGLPQSDGRVGMYGFSYQGVVQLAAASMRPRNLCAIAPAMCAADPAAGFFWTNGTFRLGFATSWGAQLAGVEPRLAERCKLGRVDEWHRWDKWQAGQCGPAYDVSRITIPALFTIGWYDTFAAAGWNDLHHYGGATSLLAAPWAHMPWAPDGDVAHDAHLAFFAEHVAARQAALTTPAVRSLAIGQSQWRTFETNPGTVRRRFGLASDGRAATRFGDGRLVDGAGEGPPNIVVHQPAVPVPSVGGLYEPGLGLTGQADQRAVQERTDVLCYTTAPFDDDIELFGAARVSLALASEAPTNDACVTLCTVAPDGATVNIAFGAARGSGRLTFDLSPTHATVPCGWRVRIAIAPSCYPELDLNTSAGPLTQVTRWLSSDSWLELEILAP
ncbi:MAG: CocE/NonD family hydrolase [Acidimicrobiia bacterium]